MSRQPRTDNLGTAEWLIGAAQRNPEGLLLVAAGCALLMRRTSHGRQFQAKNYRTPDDRREMHARENARDGGETAREYMSDVSEKLSSGASSLASSAADYVQEAGNTISETSGRVARQAQSTVQDLVGRVIQDRPLTLALVGVAA
jgi:hypothetical protein